MVGSIWKNGQNFNEGTETFFFCKRPGTSPKKVRACGKKNYEEKKIMVGKKKYAGVFGVSRFFKVCGNVKENAGICIFEPIPGSGGVILQKWPSC